MHTSKNIPTFLVSVLFCVFVVVACIFVVKNINDRMDRTATILGDIDGLTKKVEEYQVFERIVKTTEVDRAKISSYVIKKDGLVDFIKLIESMATASGVEVVIKTVVESEVQNQATSSPKVMLTMPLSATGTWENISMFFALLESMPYKTNLPKADVKRLASEEVSDANSKKRRFSKVNPGWQGDFEFGVLKFK